MQMPTANAKSPDEMPMEARWTASQSELFLRTHFLPAGLVTVLETERRIAKKINGDTFGARSLLLFRSSEPTANEAAEICVDLSGRESPG